MIQKVSISVVMDTDMKVSGKMAKSMAKVRNRDLLYDFLFKHYLMIQKVSGFGGME